jgi:SPP1 gp7 family putative phage head morphogenesis protein
MTELKDLYVKLGDKIDLPEARKYKRLEGVILAIADEYKKVTGQAIVATGVNSFQSYQSAFYSYTWSMETTIIGDYDLNAPNMGASWGVIPADAIRASVMSEASGLTYIKTFDRSKMIRLTDIQSALTRGLANGHSYRKTAKAIETVFNNGYSDAMRVVRTESGRNFTQGFLEAHDRAVVNGIEVKKQWVSSLDSRTRHDHAVADGQIADKNGMFHVGGSTGRGPGLLDDVSQVVNCRCRLIDIVEGFPPELRRYGEDIGPYQTFSEWAKPLGWTKENGWKIKK